MKLFSSTLLFLVTLSCYSAQVIIPITTQQNTTYFNYENYTSVGFSYAGGTSVSPVGDLYLLGFGKISSTTSSDTIAWDLSPQAFPKIGYPNTNVSMSFNVFATNGVGQGNHTYAYRSRLRIYTNNTYTTTFTNAFTPLYDSGYMTNTGSFPNGTNIVSFGPVFTISTNVIWNTNISFSLVELQHVPIGASTGNEWPLNGGYINFK